ncbi:MAG: KEOPS complex subunit Pcc1 [Candidatus Hadarchaeales archaeon]
MKMKAELEIEYEDEKTARALAEALTPDNLEAPNEMKIITKSEGCVIFTEINFSGRIRTLIATIDDLLSCLQAAEEAIGLGFTKEKVEE